MTTSHCEHTCFICTPNKTQRNLYKQNQPDDVSRLTETHKDKNKSQGVWKSNFCHDINIAVGTYFIWVVLVGGA